MAHELDPSVRCRPLTPSLSPGQFGGVVDIDVLFGLGTRSSLCAQKELSSWTHCRQSPRAVRGQIITYR